MTAREAVLAALGPSRTEPRPGSFPAPRVDGDLWSLFVHRLQAVGRTLGSSERLAEAPGPFWLEPGLERLWPDLEPASDPWEAETGVGRASLAVAETGSLLFASGPQKPRLLSLLPPRHVAILDPARLVATLEEAIAHLDGRSWVAVTGPSRTADIEGVLVRGVHGPGELIVVPFPE